MSRPVTYEVYEKRALHEDYRQLPLLDRTPRKERAVASANAWGGVVLRLTAAPDGTVAAEVVHVHRRRSERATAPVVTLKGLLGRLYPDSRRPVSRIKPRG